MSEVVGQAQAFAGLVDLASEAVGGVAVLCSDDFFAEKENLLKVGPAEFLPDEYTDRGKWMDGWESRRKRVPGHDWCIVRLGVPGRVRGVDIDTAFFLGNHPPFASIDACTAPNATPEQLRDEVRWTPILSQVALKRGSQNLQAIASEQEWTHVRLNIYPDGGVARLRVYGEPTAVGGEAEVDLACLTHGGRAVACSDMFFAPMNNLLLPGRATNMGKGWETRRSRPPGQDWIIVALGTPGTIDRIVLDTNHFKGNYPDRAAIDGLYWPAAPPASLIDHPDWTEIVPTTKLRAHDERTVAVTRPGPWTHVRLRIYPDGGVSRMRAWGRPTAHTPAQTDRLVRWLNELGEALAAEAFARCCGSRRWVESMLAARPFTSRTQLFGHAETAWWHLGDGDWREAFSHHPRIGADVAKLREKFASTAAWSQTEQAGVAGADDHLLEALAAGNRDYEARFGHIFIVCATGLSAAEMLDRLRSRIDNAPEAELRIAAGEQAKITRLRLLKLEPS